MAHWFLFKMLFEQVRHKMYVQHRNIEFTKSPSFVEISITNNNGEKLFILYIAAVRLQWKKSAATSEITHHLTKAKQIYTIHQYTYIHNCWILIMCQWNHIKIHTICKQKSPKTFPTIALAFISPHFIAVSNTFFFLQRRNLCSVMSLPHEL